MLQYNPTVSGSLIITGSLTVTNGVIGTVSGVDVQIFSSSINQVITGIQSTTSSQDGRLSSIETFTSSTSARLGSIETITASNLARLGSIETITASNLARIGALETKSASVDTTNTTQNARLSALETTSASVDTLNTTQNTRLTNLENKTGSLATTGSNTFIGNQTISGTLFIQNNLVVQGSSSLQNITASAVSVGTNTILLNTSNPSIRFAGISAIDSGSAAGTSGSLYFDSTDNEWIFVHQGNVAVTSSTVITGPETYDSVGNETRLTTNVIPKSTNSFHITDSCIFDNGTTTCIKNNLVGTGTACFTGTICAPSLVACNGSIFLQRGANSCNGLIISEQGGAITADKAASIRTAGGTSNHLFLTPGIDANTNACGYIKLGADRYSCVGINIAPTYTLSIQGFGDHRLYHYNCGSTSSDKAVIQVEVCGDTSGNAYFAAGKTGTVWSFGRNTTTGNFEVRSNWDLSNDTATRFQITTTGISCFSNTICSTNLILNTSSDGYNMLCLVATGGDAGMYLKGGATNSGGWSIQSRNSCQFAIVDRTTGSNIDRFVLTNNLLKLCQGNSGASAYSLTGGLQIESTSITGINILSPDTGYGRIYFSAPTGGTTAGAVEYIHCATPACGFMKLRANAIDALYVSGNGYIGIGIQTPSVPLHVCTSGSQISRFTTTYSLSSGYADFVTLLASGQTGGGLSFNIGKQEASYNLGKMVFNYVGDQSSSNNLSFGFYNYDNKLVIVGDGTVRPGANGTQNLGSSSYRWSTVYTSDLDLSNGIGDYTIVEGENDLFLYNNKQCKVYRFMLEQVCAECATPKKI
jgi:hypothetical protein